MKKVLSLVLALMMCMSAFAFTASAAINVEYDISIHPLTFVADGPYFNSDDTDPMDGVTPIDYILEANNGDYITIGVQLDDFTEIVNWDMTVKFDENTFEPADYAPYTPATTRPPKPASGDIESNYLRGESFKSWSGTTNTTAEAVAQGFVKSVYSGIENLEMYDYYWPEYMFVFRLKVATEEVKAVTFEMVPAKVSVVGFDNATDTWSVNGGVNPTMTVYLNGYDPNTTTECEHADTTTTYTNNGDTHTVTVTCNNPECGKVVSETEEAHTWGEPVVVDSTCDVAGTATYTCTADGCGATKVEDLELAEHGATTKAYANNGETHTVTETCGVCNEVVNTYDEAHTWGAEPVETVESTCAVAGYEVYECTADGCGAQNTVDLPLADHETVLEYTPATTEAAGYVKEYCVVDGCGYVVREEVIEIKTEVFGEAETQDNDAGVKIVAGINKLEVKSAGFIITGKTGLAIDLAVAKADAEQYIVAEATKAYAVVNGWIAEDAFGTGYAMALQLTGLEEFAGKTLYITAYAEGYDGNVEYVDAGSYTIQ